MNKILFGCLLFGFLAGCNTLQGLGTDIKKGGEAIEKAADKAK
ncbi:entericidin A/B family lipoprotein [Ampullimonas aquatilis]